MLTSIRNIFVYYIIIMNLLTFTAFGMDKLAAIRKCSRIRVATLLGLSFAGGSVGALLAMYLFRHKTRKTSFTVGVPLMLILQIVGIGLFVYYNN